MKRPEARRLILFLAICIAALPASIALAGQPDETLPGFKSDNVFDSHGIDNVNLMSGDPGVVIPLGPVYTLGPGYQWQLKAYNTSKIWHFDGGCLNDPGYKHAFISGDPTLGAGWSLGVGYVERRSSNPNDFYASYHSPDGGHHEARFTTGGFSQYTTIDGSRLRITHITSPSESYTVEYPDGTIHEFKSQSQEPIYPPSDVHHDFTELDWDGQTGPFPRFNLTDIKDSFGNTLLSVTYEAGSPWEIATINLSPLTNLRTITFSWTASGSYPVLSNILFPASAGANLKAAFAFQSVSILRNNYDNSSPSLQCALGTSLTLPQMTGVTLSDNGTGSVFAIYGFIYFEAPSPDPVPIEEQGALQKITLPTGGTIQYTYGVSSGGSFTTCTQGSCNNLTTAAPIEQPLSPIDPNIQKLSAFLDKSAAVASRVETDSLTGKTSTTTYDRATYVATNPISPFNAYTNTIFRRVTMTRPGNDSNGTAQYATRHYFHVSYTDGSDDPAQDSGLELDRRTYPASDPAATPIREIITCYAGTCGYQDGSGNLNTYYLTDRQPPSAEVTWYGAVPGGVNGGTCSGTSPACTKAANSNYVALPTERYRTTTVTSTLPAMAGWTQRVTTTNWTPQTAVGEPWLLDLFSYHKVTDSGTIPAPASAETDNTYELIAGGYTNGFLTKARTIDGTNYVETIFTDDGKGNPTQINRDGSGTVSATTFTDTLTFQNSLALSSQRTGIGWKSFDVTRDSPTGWITTSRDPNPTLSTGYTYDSLGRIKTITPPSETATTIAYSLPTQTTVSRGSGSSGTWQQFLYDGLGRLSREIRQLSVNATGGFAVRLHKYDAAGHPTFVSEWTSCNSASACATTSPASGTTKSNFDPFGRPQTITKADNTVTTISYADNAPVITNSDSLESVTVSVNGSSATTVTRKDALGRVISVQEPLVAGAADTTTYTYNALDKLGKVTQGSQTRTFTYDALGFLRSETNPEINGTTSYGPYDALGDLLGKTEGVSPSAVTSTLTYDPAGRLWTDYAAGVEYVANCYDGTAAECPEGKPNFAGGTYHLGRLTRRYGYNPSITTNASTDDFTYSDLTGRLSAESTTANPGTGLTATQSWTYTPLGLVLTHNHPRASGTFPVTYTYSFGLPTTIVANGTTVASSVGYNPAGGLQSWIDGGTITTTISPNVIPSRPASISTSNGAFSTGSYAYDGAGNITAIGSDTFKYDARSRLASAVFSGQATPCTDSLGNTLRGQCFAYDRFGNLTGVSGDGPRALTTSTTNNHLSSGTYDTRGNLTLFGAETLTWDSINRQIREQSSGVDWKYLYDGANERIGRIPASGTTFYTFRDEGSRVATEYAGTAVGRDNVFLGNLMVASFVTSSLSGTPGWTYFHSDHLGTPRYLTGAETGSPKYWPYGDEVTVNTTTQKLRFATMERDLEANHYYDHARSHDFNLGRFLGVDKSGGHPTGPQSWNRYAYARTNPLRFNDPNGLETNPVTGGSGIEDSDLRTTATNPDIGRFGETRTENGEPKFHGGDDLVAAAGTPLHAPVGGTAQVFTTKDGGLIVAIVTSRDGQAIRESVAHLRSASVKTGDKVSEGQIIARSGVSGNAKDLTGDQQHTHLAVRIDGKLVDPQPYFADHPSKATAPGTPQEDSPNCVATKEKPCAR